jgi:hypothetical protein
MPYYENKNILYIHIPKTGGTSIENFFFKKFNVVPCFQSLHSDGQVLKEIPYSLQHSTFNDIKNNNKYFNIDFNNLTIISSVRNPYDRIISHLFFKNLIKKDENPEIVEQILKDLLIRKNYFKYDNHITPQYIFIMNKNKILKKCVILKMENLQSNMNRLGFNDFDFFQNVSNKYEYNNIHNIKYLKYLNKKSIFLINNFYKYDFIIFNYKMININNFNIKIQEIKQDNIKIQEIEEDDIKIQEIKQDNIKIQEIEEDDIKIQEIKQDNIKIQEIEEDNIKQLRKNKIDEYKKKINNIILSNEEIKNKREHNLKLNNIIDEKILLSKKVNINKNNIKKINNKMEMIFIKNK